MKGIIAVVAWFVVSAAAIICCAADGPTGVITGRWVPVTGPIADAKVSFFSDISGPPPSHERSWRAADQTTSTDAAGKFTITLPAGRYFMGMTRHRAGSEPGPPQDGELHNFSRDETGQPMLYPVFPGTTTDIGVIAEAAPFRKEQGLAETAIEGTVTDDFGMAASGVLVFAYANPEMSGKPRFVSERTGADGKYRLIVDEGEYYLKIRNRYGGGQPDAGELMGGYGEFGDPAVVQVKQGILTKGINIQGKRFTGRVRKQ